MFDKLRLKSVPTVTNCIVSWLAVTNSIWWTPSNYSIWILNPSCDISYFSTLPSAAYGSFLYRSICHVCHVGTFSDRAGTNTAHSFHGLSLSSLSLLWCRQSVIRRQATANDQPFCRRWTPLGLWFEMPTPPDAHSNKAVHRSRPIAVSQQHPDCRSIYNPTAADRGAPVSDLTLDFFVI